MGRQITATQEELAYIAGFLDGDGSIIFQVKRRKDTPRGNRLMLTIAFYQDSRHEKPLFWIRKVLGIGYISRRNDGMTELRINGYATVAEILQLLTPYIRFKKGQVTYILTALRILNAKPIMKFSSRDKRTISAALLKARALNYQSGQKKLAKLKADLRAIYSL